MKLFSAFFIVASLMAISLSSNAGVSGKNFEYYGYMRTGVGMGSDGSNQTCFKQPGVWWANEFRLGNECEHIYGETGFSAFLMRGEKDSDPYFKSNILLAFHAPGNKVWKTTNYGVDRGQDVTATEAYIEAGNIDGLPMKWWVGKRYYRFQDVHMYDWYYWGNLGGGNGAGVSDIQMGPGKFAAAILVQSPDMATTSNGLPSGTSYGGIPSSTRVDVYSTDGGQPQMRILDLKYDGLALTDKMNLNFWLAVASSPSLTRTETNADTGVTTPTNIESGTGRVFGVRLHNDLEGGFNDFSVMHGVGLLNGFNIYESIWLEANSTTKDANRLRVIEHITKDLSPSWALHGVFAHDSWDNGASTNSKGSWTSIAVRPVWMITDHFHLVTEIGTSTVKNDGADDQKLTRITVAPELAVAHSIWARPTIRAFVTYSTWSDSLKNSFGAPYAGKTSGSSIGFQGEVWF